MRKQSDLQTDLMPIDNSNLWDGLFGGLPNELVVRIISYLNLKEYVSFAETSKKHRLGLSNLDFINIYDPLLATILKVTLFFIDKAFEKKFVDNYSPIDVIKKIIPLCTEMKAKVLATEIDLEEKFLIALLNCSLSGMSDVAKKELKWDFLSKVFENYFKIRKHFIFDMEDLPSVFTDPTKLDFLITCIDQNEAGSFRPDSLHDNAKGSMVLYFYAKLILVALPLLDQLPPEKRKLALTRAEQHFIESWKAGALNALFLERLIYQRLISYKINSKLNLRQAITPFEFEKSVAEFLGIEKLDEKSLYEILGEHLVIWLCSAPSKTLKVLKKLLASNTMDEVRTLDKEPTLWECLIKRTHSLEFLNAFHGKVASLQELNAAKFLESICNSPSAFIMGAILQKEILERPEAWMQILDPALEIWEFSADLQRLYRDWIELQQYYPDLSFVEFFLNVNAAQTLLSLWLAKTELMQLTKISFPILMKIVQYFNFYKKLDSFLNFLVSENGADLLGYFQVDYLNLVKTQTKKKPIDILRINIDDNLYLELLTTPFYKYFKKSGFSIPQILRTAKDRLAMIRNWFAGHEYLFEKWTCKEIRKFIKLIHLKDGGSVNGKKRNVHAFQAAMSLRSLLKTSQGEIIPFKDFKNFIESEIVMHMKARSCELLYRHLGFKKLEEYSGNQIIVNGNSINLLRALSDLNVDRLVKILTIGREDIELLKQLVIRPVPTSPSVSVSFFPTPSKKRPPEQTLIAEDELTDNNHKVPRLSNSKAEEE